MKIFADGADLGYMRTAPAYVAGFTTNPSLVRAAGVTDYREFARQALEAAGDRPVSLEVFADDSAVMLAEARTLASWGENVYVKIPVVNTSGQSTAPVVAQLLADGVKVNVTAVFTDEHLWAMRESLRNDTPAIVSVFAGRLADAGYDPVAFVKSSLGCFWQHENVEILWASIRELWNLVEAERIGTHIITVTPALLAKYDLIGKDPGAYAIETVQQFRRDALASGLSIETTPDRAIMKVEEG